MSEFFFLATVIKYDEQKFQEGSFGLGARGSWSFLVGTDSQSRR